MRFLYCALVLVTVLAPVACASSGSTKGGDGDGDLSAGGTFTGDGDIAGSGGSVASGGGTSTGGVLGPTGGSTAVGGSSGTGGGGPVDEAPFSMGYILDLERWGAGALDALDYTAVDYVIHAFYTADGAGAVVPVNDTVTKYRDAGLVGKVHAAGGRIVMSLGGANHSFPLKQVAANPSLRSTFVANIVQRINEWDYDGVDLDLEFPAGGNEPQEHLALMTDLYTAIKANNPSHVAMFGISPGWYLDQFLWSQLGAFSDYGFYFCYDWDFPANGPMKNPGQNFSASGGATFEASCQGAMNYMIAEGYPASQIVLGMGFYSSSGAHYADIPVGAKTITPHADYMEASDGGNWWLNVESARMKIDAVLNPTQSVLMGGATAAGVGFWEWGYENPASPDLSAAIRTKLDTL